jgi:hypothetical protein
MVDRPGLEALFKPWVGQETEALRRRFRRPSPGPVPSTRPGSTVPASAQIPLDGERRAAGWDRPAATGAELVVIHVRAPGNPGWTAAARMAAVRTSYERECERRAREWAAGRCALSGWTGPWRSPVGAVPTATMAAASSAASTAPSAARLTLVPAAFTRDLAAHNPAAGRPAPRGIGWQVQQPLQGGRPHRRPVLGQQPGQGSARRWAPAHVTEGSGPRWPARPGGSTAARPAARPRTARRW